jgi:hypothetical protein
VIPTGSGAAAPREIVDESVRFERDERAIEPLIHMLGTIETDGKVEVLSVARIETRYLRGNGRQTGYIAQHLDSEGRVLAEDNVYAYRSEGGRGRIRSSGDCGCDDCHDESQDRQPVLFKAMLRDTAPGATLRIVKRGEVVWERRAGQPPVIEGARAALNKNGDLELS